MKDLALHAPLGVRRHRDRLRPRLAGILMACLVLAAGGGLAWALASRSGGPKTASFGLRLLGPAPAAERIGFTLVLRMPGAARLHASIAAIEDPRSGFFRHFIGPRSFGERFGISRVILARLERAVRSSGLHVSAAYPQRTELVVDGTVRKVERLLRVRIATYADAAGHRFHSPLGVPVVPFAFKHAVDGVTGLDTRPRWRPHDVPMGGLTPTTSARAYDVTALRDEGFSGQGQRIAVISFSAFDPNDPAVWANHYGITGPTPRVIAVDGGTSDTSGASEANLDIEVVRAIAPGAQVLVYEVPQSSSSYSDVINRIVADHSTDVISSSWGQCELGLDPSERTADTRALNAAIASGISMFVASGDSGAFDCQQGDLSDHRLSVDWPASSGDAIAVGGTRLYLNPDGSYLKEAAWEGQLSGAGGGGGVTIGDARPSWQSGPGVLSGFSNGRRQLPDVSADADPGTPWSIYSGGQPRAAGGTSAAAPFWAASTLLIHQYAASHGVGRLGYINPILYALAASTQPFQPFHDVTLGGNRYYQAVAGWDPATGLGSPDVYNVARDMVAYLRAHPPR